GEVRARPGRSELLQRPPGRVECRHAFEALLADRENLRERRVPVLRHVCVATGREVVAEACPRVLSRGLPESRRDPRNLRHVASGCDDHRHERRVLAVSKQLHRPLVRLIRGIARDRERLQPALRDALRRIGAEDREDEPEPDHHLAAPQDEPGQPLHCLGVYTLEVGLRKLATIRSRETRTEAHTASWSTSSTSAPTIADTPSAGTASCFRVFARSAAPITSSARASPVSPT